MGASTRATGRARRVFAVAVSTVGVALLTSTSAGASSRTAVVATTSTNNGLVLVSLGGGILLLAVIGFVLFTWTRRKKRPIPCAEQREALALAEKSVQYWQAARAHLEAAEQQRSSEDASNDPTHASLVAKAVEGLGAAIQQRDRCQMELIQCMASGVPAAPTVSPIPGTPQPFFIPGPDGTPPS